MSHVFSEWFQDLQNYTHNGRQKMIKGDHTTHAKINATEKIDPPKPSWSPMATARAETVAE